MVSNLDKELITQTGEQIKFLQSQPEVDKFHKLWYETSGMITWGATRWMGVPMAKCPFDMFVMQDIIHDLKPDLIIETGTWCGGSALFYASICDMLGKGKIITIDTEPMIQVSHSRVECIQSSSIDLNLISDLNFRAEHCNGPVIVILDSDHSAAHVAKELELYSTLVTPGSYLIVEDTNISHKPVTHGWYPDGPYPAVEAFLKEHPEFTQDSLCEHYLLTMHPGGWLRKSNG